MQSLTVCLHTYKITNLLKPNISMNLTNIKVFVNQAYDKYRTNRAYYQSWIFITSRTMVFPLPNFMRFILSTKGTT